MKLLSIIVFLLVFILFGCKDNKNPYGLDIISDVKEYSDMVKKDSMMKLVDVEEYVNDVALDIRYATTDNFTGEVIYNQPRAFVRLPVARALAGVQLSLNKMGLGLKIYDAYRPYQATLKFYEIYGDTMFVAAPWKGSRHNRGCAVDVSLIDLETGLELEMPTLFDDFSAKAHAYSTDINETARENRDLLIKTMTENGFTVYPYEWWHYDFTGWENFELMDIPFYELDNQKNNLVFIKEK